MLYFFYEIASMTWGFDPQDKGSARVYYFPGDISELSRTGFPSVLADEFVIPEMPIAFSSKNELPDFEKRGSAAKFASVLEKPLFFNRRQHMTPGSA